MTGATQCEGCHWPSLHAEDHCQIIPHPSLCGPFGSNGSVLFSAQNLRQRHFLKAAYNPIWQAIFSKVVMSVTQSCPTLCDPMDCNPPGSSVHEILQARTLECSVTIFLGSKVTADGGWIAAMKFKGHLLLGRKAMTNPDSILKSRDITLPTKVCLVKAMVFPVVMCGCESWTVTKAECQRIDAFELWCWRRLLRVPCTERRSNQSILKEISPGCIGKTDAKAETPNLWPPHVKS